MQIEIRYVSPRASFAEMERQFRLIPAVLQADTYRKASFRGAKAVVALAVATAPTYEPKPPQRLPNKSARWRFKDNVVAVRGSARQRRRGRGKVGASYAWARAYHANLVEWGSVHNVAHHTMRRAGEAAGPQVVAGYEREIRNTMRRIDRQLRSGRISRRTARAFGSL